MVELEMTFEKLEKEVKIVNKNSEELKRTYLNLTELRSMLKKTQQFFDEVSNHFLLCPICYLSPSQNLRQSYQFICQSLNDLLVGFN